jgi:hypothetical protein
MVPLGIRRIVLIIDISEPLTLTRQLLTPAPETGIYDKLCGNLNDAGVCIADASEPVIFVAVQQDAYTRRADA